MANQIGLKPGGNVTGGQKESLPGEKHIMSNITSNKETGIAIGKDKKGIYKGEITPGDKIMPCRRVNLPVRFCREISISPKTT